LQTSEKIADAEALHGAQTATLKQAEALPRSMESVAARPSRLYYIDNLRIVLSSLVVLFHLSVTYGAAGSWAYVETQAEFPASYFLTLFTATCQSFFMGMFFFISAYFSYGALARKGTRLFLQDRLIRLGIPLVLYIFFLEPLTFYFAHSWQPEHLSFLEILRLGYARHVGVMWFVVALGCFTLLYTAARPVLSGLQTENHEKSFALKSRYIVVFILLLGVVTFLVRLTFYVGRAIPLLGFNLGHFPQYIALFTLGILAAQYRLRAPISLPQAKRWSLFALAMVLFGFPAMFLAGGAASGEIEPFLGGMHWQSLGYSVWEQATGISIIIGLLGLTRVKWNKTGKVERELAGAAYALYVFHPPIVVAVSIFFRDWTLPPLTKFLVLSPMALAASLVVALSIRKIPFAKRVF